MKKPLTAIIVLLLIALFIGFVHNHKSATTIPTDPNIIHVPQHTEEDISQSISQIINQDARPEWNDFNEKDQIVVDRHTNTFYIYSISDDAYNTFEQESNYMAFKGVKTITINLHSPGGDLDSADFIVEQIRLLKAQGITVNTIVDKKNACMSACPLVFFAGDTRTAYDNSVFMYHAPYAQFPYNISEPMINVIEHQLRQSREEYAHTLTQVCKKDPDIARDVIDHGNHFYIAKDLDVRCGPSTMFTQVIPVVEESPAIPDLGIPGVKTGSDLLQRVLTR